MRHGQGIQQSIINQSDGGKEKEGGKEGEKEDKEEKKEKRYWNTMSSDTVMDVMMERSFGFDGQACASAIGLSTCDMTNWKARSDMTAEEKEASQRRCNFGSSHYHNNGNSYRNQAYVGGYTIHDKGDRNNFKIREMDTSKFPLLTNEKLKWKSLR